MRLLLATNTHQLAEGGARGMGEGRRSRRWSAWNGRRQAQQEVERVEWAKAGAAGGGARGMGEGRRSSCLLPTCYVLHRHGIRNTSGKKNATRDADCSAPNPPRCPWSCEARTSDNPP
jgi:hypothetical protein